MDFKTKKRIKFVTLKRGTRMVFEDRLAYSFLLARPSGLSAARLAKLSGIDRTRTLPKVLARLSESGLLTKTGNRYFGVPSECVVTDTNRKQADTWHDTICYQKFYLPTAECPLTKKQLAVYYLKLGGKDSTSLIAKLLAISRPTVINAVKVLKQHGLLDTMGDPVTVSAEKLAWWQDKSQVAVGTDGDLEHLSNTFSPLIQALDSHSSISIAAHPWKTELDKFGRRCKEAGYSFRRVVDLLVKTVERLGSKPSPVARVFKELPTLIDKAEKQTNTNRRLNGYKGSSSFGLFQCKLKDLVKTEKAKLKAG